MASSVKSIQKKEYFVNLSKLIEETKGTVESSVNALKETANIMAADATDEIYNRVVLIAKAYEACMNDTLTFAVDGLDKMSKNTHTSQTLAEECGSLKGKVDQVRESPIRVEQLAAKRDGNENLTDSVKEEFSAGLTKFINIRADYIHAFKKMTGEVEDTQFQTEVGMPAGARNEKCTNAQVAAYRAIKKQCELLDIAVGNELTAFASGTEEIRTTNADLEEASKVTAYGEI